MVAQTTPQVTQAVRRTRPKNVFMKTYADELREFADLLDKDFRGNLFVVLEELARMMTSMIATAAQQERAADGLTSAQKEEVRQMIQSALDTGSA